MVILAGKLVLGRELMIDLDAVFVPGLVSGSLIAEIIQPRPGEVGNHLGGAKAGILGGYSAKPVLRNLIVGERVSYVAAVWPRPGGGRISYDTRVYKFTLDIDRVTGAASSFQLLSTIHFTLPPSALPQPKELKAVTIGSDVAGTTSSLVGFLASVLHLADGVLKKPAESNGTLPS